MLAATSRVAKRGVNLMDLMEVMVKGFMVSFKSLDPGLSGAKNIRALNKKAADCSAAFS
jgi:hypothetical protein